jgi:amino acid permease
VLLPAPPVASMLGKKGDAELRPVVQDDAPPRHATWPTASQLIIADVIGIGVMAMAEAFAELGWVLGVACCLLMLPLNQLSGLMVWETIVEVHPDALSLADLARRCLGRAAYWATYALVYSFIFMTLGDYLLSLGLCLQILFPDAALPSYAWSALAAAMLLPFCQARSARRARIATG